MSTTTAEAPMMAPPEAMFAAEVPPSTAPAPTATAAPLLDRDALKALMKEAVVEVLHEQGAWIGSILLEAWEDRALGDAIDEGREGGFASEDEVFAILDQFR